MPTNASMRIGDLWHDSPPSLRERVVRGLQMDSRLVQRGDLFFAVPGAQSDGRQYIQQATRKGAAAIFVEKNGWTVGQEKDYRQYPIVQVADLSSRISAFADYFFSTPSADMWVTGITGSNGKTTSCYWLYHAYQRLVGGCTLISSIGCTIGEYRRRSSSMTTPDPITIQMILAQSRDTANHAAVVEVSSHGIRQGRVAAVRFNVAGFTNLSRDHLDYHGTMGAYFAAKCQLFHTPGLETAVINCDDVYGRRLIKQLPSSIQCIDIGADENAMVSVHNIHARQEEWYAEIHTRLWGNGELRLKAPGQCNIYNALMIIAILAHKGVPLNDILHTLSQLHLPPGRFQRAHRRGDDLSVWIDFAHTPQALSHSVAALHTDKKGQFWCVVGCGGNRDKGKRKQMGAIAATADYVVFTADNPRNENPQDIIDDMLKGVDTHQKRFHIYPDRTQAIEFAILQAASGDTVLIAGKGCEFYQDIAGKRLPFSDFRRARHALRMRGERRVDQ